MHIKNLFYTLFAFSCICNGPETEAQNLFQTRSMKINEALAKEMLLRLPHNVCPPARVSNKQAFEVTTAHGQFYAISTTSNSTSDEYVSSYTCSLMIFSKEGTLLNSITVVGASNLRPWTCDSTEAISFSDWYRDGSLRIIAVYGATAPSSAQFQIPVVMKLDPRRNTLSIDEELTKVLEEKNVTTIRAAKDVLKGQ